MVMLYLSFKTLAFCRLQMPSEQCSFLFDSGLGFLALDPES